MLLFSVLRPFVEIEILLRLDVTLRFVELAFKALRRLLTGLLATDHEALELSYFWL